MQKNTINLLNVLNRNFYTSQAGSFNKTRAIEWKGWFSLAPYMTELKNILDVGCGNGRFLDFLVNHDIQFENYLGIDSSEGLLQIAKGKFKKFILSEIEAERNVEFKQLDLLGQTQFSIFPFPAYAELACLSSGMVEAFSIVAVFGLMHHIPSYEKRLELIKSLSQKLMVNGYMFLTFWQFGNSPRFDKMILNQEDVDPQIAKLFSDFEEGDYLLDWDKSGLPRYCHHFSDKEIEKLKTDLKKLGLKVANEYNADGKEGNLNRYLILTPNS